MIYVTVFLLVQLNCHAFPPFTPRLAFKVHDNDDNFTSVSTVARDLAITGVTGYFVYDDCRQRTFDLLLIADGHFPSAEEEAEQMNFFTEVLDMFLTPDESELTRLKVALASLTSFGPVVHFSLLDYNKTEELKQAILNTAVVNFTDETSSTCLMPNISENSPVELFSESQGGRPYADRVVVMVLSKYTLEAERASLCSNCSSSFSTTLLQVCSNAYNATINLSVVGTHRVTEEDESLLECLTRQRSVTFAAQPTFDALRIYMGRELCRELGMFHDDSLTIGSWYYAPDLGGTITWFQAADACTATGGVVASIETQEELDFLEPRLEKFLAGMYGIWTWSVDSSYSYTAMTIGLRRKTETVAARFQWSNGHPLLLWYWYLDYPSPEWGQDCGLWEFRGTGKQLATRIVNGFVNRGCGISWQQSPLCEVPLRQHRNRPSDLITVPPANRTAFTDALDRGEFTQLDDAIVSMPANVQDLKFFRSLVNSSTGFPVFRCDPGNEPGSFIPYSYVCDHKPDCKSVRDETICLYRECDPEEFRCDSGQCVPASSRCDLFKDCYDGSDEQDCATCSGHRCLDGTCLPIHYFRDGVIDCGGCDRDTLSSYSDEYIVTWYINCILTCNRSSCVEENQLDDDFVDCTGPEGPLDETLGKLEKLQYCSTLNISRWSPLCVYVNDRYGGVLGCRDMSHLRNCQNFICSEGYVKCPGSYCIPLHYVLDGNMDCPLGEDEKNVNFIGCKGNFACSGGKVCLHPHLVCDGSPQCPSGDDELDCHVPCADGFHCIGGTVTVSHDFEKFGPLESLSFISPLTQYLNLSGVDISHNFSYENRGLFNNLIELRLSGCKLREASGGFAADLRRLRTVYLVDLSHNLITEITAHSMFSFMANLHHLDLSHNKLLSVLPLTGLQTIPGASDLEYLDLSDTAITNISQTFLQGLTRLNTLNLSLTNIEEITENTFPENFALTTLDLRQTPLDEIRPDSLKQLTIYSDLYTDNYKLCCPQYRGLGIPDHICHAPAEAVSSCFDLIRDETQRALLWLVGILALLGNVVVIVYRIVFDRGILEKSYGLFITNLSVADLLMGVYLIIIAALDVNYRGNYVFHEKTWRHSALCQTAGLLSTLSSETSAFFIFLVTVDRFLVIKFPFGQYRFSKVAGIVSCAAAWFAGFVLALIPVLPPFSDWTIYSSSGMCLGLPLTTERPGGWGYSVAIFIVLNFITFLVIACGQYLIYRTMSENRMTGTAVAHNNARRAQDIMVAKQLSLVALSDFFCWFPIGFMGLLALSGHEISKDAYTWSAVLVLPVNSALNPVLYTVPVLLDKWEKFKTRGFTTSTTSETRGLASTTGKTKS